MTPEREAELRKIAESRKKWENEPWAYAQIELLDALQRQRDEIEGLRKALERYNVSSEDELIAAWAEDVALLALSRPSDKEPEGWRKIETAPKDGTPVLGWSKGWNGQDIICWQHNTWYASGDYLEKFNYPTHWQPLPPPPSPEKEG